MTDHSCVAVAAFEVDPEGADQPCGCDESAWRSRLRETTATLSVTAVSAAVPAS